MSVVCDFMSNLPGEMYPWNANNKRIKFITFQYFLDTDGLRFFLDGSVSEVPVHFKVALTVNIDAIAEVKD